ncbi:MAG: hypothetical protein PHF63_02495 [Herbinix sp.]|nr:hypothetical protein [Herbinix sp.]
MVLLELIADKEKYLDLVKKEWLSAPDVFPSFLNNISKETKIKNEHYLQTFFTDFGDQLKKYRKIPIGRKKWRKKTINLLQEVLYKESIIGLHHSMDHQTIDAFVQEIKEFLHQVREFAPELSFADIGQAIRNYIVYAMFKELHNVKSGFNIAGFGYSMLYPFTDNYIDSKICTEKEKQEYNQIIRDKIKGKDVHPKTLHQSKTCELLQAIESAYPRDCDTQVFPLLLMMLEAQETSIKQQSKDLLLTYEERLNISIYKGGISVLIDRFFVNKEITEADLIFYLSFGYFLQLADDLQDIKEDSTQGHCTIFTLDLKCSQEEKVVNKMLHFVHQITYSYPSENNSFKYFILSSCYQLIYSSIAGSKEFFSRDYLDRIETYLPVTYPYLDKLLTNRIENREFKIQANYMNIMDELIK